MNKDFPDFHQYHIPTIDLKSADNDIRITLNFQSDVMEPYIIRCYNDLHKNMMLYTVRKKSLQLSASSAIAGNASLSFASDNHRRALEN